jgi:hypothetical protein
MNSFLDKDEKRQLSVGQAYFAKIIAGHQLFTPVILATQEAEIRRILVL